MRSPFPSQKPDQNPINLLLVQDLSVAATAITKEIPATRQQINWQQVDTQADYLACLSQQLDLVVADYNAIGLKAFDALQILQQSKFELPFIVINGDSHASVAVKFMKAGARDYLLCDQLARLPQVIQQTLLAAKERSQHCQKTSNRTQQQLQALIVKNADGIIVVDQQRIVRFINPAALSLLGRKAEALVGQFFGFPVVGSDYLEVDLPSSTGEIQVAQMRVTEIEWQGELSYLVSLREITELKRAEAERIQLLEDAQAANRAKDQFLAVLSHELRTPLNPILGWTQLLRRRQMNEAQTTKALEIIEQNATLQLRLIEDLLDISRMIRGKLTLQARPVDLVNVINNALETVSFSAQAKSIEINTHLKAEVGLVNGDSTRLQQSVWNLVSNATKFTPSGGQIDIYLFQEGTNACIQVSDTGKGIAPEFLPHVFDYFLQADSTTTRASSGLGLGLAIVRHLVELHGGSVTAESPGEGQGATFKIFIPLLASSEITKSEQSPTQNPTTLAGVPVLVAEDEADTRELLVFILKQLGAKVLAVASGSEALAAFPGFKPELLISDLSMAKMDGYQLIRQIRALPPERGGQIPALSLSALASPTNEQESLEAGFNRHLTKPVNIDNLIDILSQLLRQEAR